MTADRDLYDLAEACRRLSISDKYARNLIKAGTLSAVRQGRKICISHEAISDYLASLKPGPRSESEPLMTVPNADIVAAVLATLDGLSLRITGVDALVDHVESQI